MNRKYPDKLHLKVFQLRSDGLTYREIANITGVTFPTVYKWVQDKLKDNPNLKEPFSTPSKKLRKKPNG